MLTTQKKPLPEPTAEELKQAMRAVVHGVERHIALNLPLEDFTVLRAMLRFCSDHAGILLGQEPYIGPDLRTIIQRQAGDRGHTQPR